MRVYIYPAYNAADCSWCCLLRDTKNNTKVIKGQEWREGYLNLQLTAIAEAIKIIKYPVDLIIYTHLKLIQVAINEGLINRWQKNNWYDNGKVLSNYNLWEDIFINLKNHKSVKVIRCRYIEDKWFNKAFLICNKN